jgi:hypothetical protein
MLGEVMPTGREGPQGSCLFDSSIRPRKALKGSRCSRPWPAMDPSPRDRRVRGRLAMSTSARSRWTIQGGETAAVCGPPIVGRENAHYRLHAVSASLWGHDRWAAVLDVHTEPPVMAALNNVGEGKRKTGPTMFLSRRGPGRADRPRSSFLSIARPPTPSPTR